MTATTIPKRSPEVQAARNALRRKGWTITAAAAELGVHRVHLSYVLCENRQSKRLLKAIHELPENPQPA